MKLTAVCLDREGFTVILSACYAGEDVHSKDGWSLGQDDAYEKSV